MYLPNIDSSDVRQGFRQLLLAKVSWLLLMGFVIFYLPWPKALQEPGWIDALIISWTPFIPSIEKWSKLSSFPTQTATFLLLAWLAIPIQAYLVFRDSRTREEFLDAEARSGTGALHKLVTLARIAIPLIIFIALGAIFPIVDVDSCRICINSSRIWQLFFGCLYSLTCALLLAYVGIQVRSIFKEEDK